MFSMLAGREEIESRDFLSFSFEGFTSIPSDT